jgi:general stress protein 26
MPRVERFEDLAADFRARVERIVWCTVTTVNRQGRPRSRLLHPLWEGSTGWILTGRHTLKAKHLAKNPWVSLTYWDQQQEQVHAECRAEWEERLPEKKRVWDFFKERPAPLGYDPALFWPAGPEDPGYGVLRLVPWRIELWSLTDLMSGKPPRAWEP